MNYQSIYDHDAIQEANTSMYRQTWDTTYDSPESAEMIHLPTGRRFIIHWEMERDGWTGRNIYLMHRLAEQVEYSGRTFDEDVNMLQPELDGWVDAAYRDEDTLIDAAEQMTEYIISNA